MLKALRSGHWPIFILSSFSSIANLFLPIVLTRILDPTAIGIYKVFFLYIGALPFLFLTGGPLNSVYYWAGKQEEDRKEYFNQSFILSLTLSFGILLIGLPFTYQLAELSGLSSTFIILMLLSAFFWVPGSFYSEALIATGHRVHGSLYGAFFEILKVATFILLAYVYQSIEMIFFAHCIILGTKFFTSTGLGLRKNIMAFNLNTKKLKEVFDYCFPISLSGLVSFFIDKMDQFVLASFLLAKDFAFYSMGCLVIPPLLLLEMSINKVLVPKLSQIINNQSNDGAKTFRKAIGDCAFLLIPASFGLYLYAEEITVFLYTEKFLESAQYLKIFAFSYLLYLIPYDAVPRAAGKTDWIFKLTVTVAPFGLGAIVFTAMFMPPQAVLMTALIFKAIPRLAGLIYSGRLIGSPTINLVPWRKLLTFILVCFFLSISSMALRPLFDSPQSWFYLTAPIFAVCYFLLLYVPYKKGLLDE